MNKTTIAAIMSAVGALLGVGASILSGTSQLDTATLGVVFAAFQPLLTIILAKAQIAAHVDEHHADAPTAPPAPPPPKVIPGLLLVAVILLPGLSGCVSADARVAAAKLDRDLAIVVQEVEPRHEYTAAEQAAVLRDLAATQAAGHALNVALNGSSPPALPPLEPRAATSTAMPKGD